LSSRLISLGQNLVEKERFGISRDRRRITGTAINIALKAGIISSLDSLSLDTFES
jgi:hypothetical protein